MVKVEIVVPVVVMKMLQRVPLGHRPTASMMKAQLITPSSLMRVPLLLRRPNVTVALEDVIKWVVRFQNVVLVDVTKTTPPILNVEQGVVVNEMPRIHNVVLVIVVGMVQHPVEVVVPVVVMKMLEPVPVVLRQLLRVLYHHHCHHLQKQL